MLWKKSVYVKVISSSPNHIDALVGEAPDDQWRFTRVYGFVNLTRKLETWLCTEDFNGFVNFTVSFLSHGCALRTSTRFFSLMKSLALDSDKSA